MTAVDGRATGAKVSSSTMMLSCCPHVLFHVTGEFQFNENGAITVLPFTGDTSVGAAGGVGMQTFTVNDELVTERFPLIAITFHVYDPWGSVTVCDVVVDGMFGNAIAPLILMLNVCVAPATQLSPQNPIAHVSWNVETSSCDPLSGVDGTGASTAKMKHGCFTNRGLIDVWVVLSPFETLKK